VKISIAYFFHPISIGKNHHWKFDAAEEPGVMEYWSIGKNKNTSLHHSNTPNKRGNSDLTTSETSAGHSRSIYFRGP
jgi:hypothetical protein